MCDRLLVMSKGEIVGEFRRDAFDKEAVLRTAFREAEAAA
jgi:ribose transport system ATP-binding protein